MKRKNKIILTLIFLNITVFYLCANGYVKAQGPYSLGIQEDKEYIWEVTYLDSSLFGRILGYEPNFDVGDKIRVIIKEIVDVETYWRITIYFWDYQVDWGQQGVLENIELYKLAAQYEHCIFLPTPVDNFLESVGEQFPADYQVDGFKISQILKSEIDEEYLHERIYNSDGILESEAVYEYANTRLIIKVEATFIMIPMGIYFIGFILLAVIAIIFISTRNKKYSIKVL
ncbi:MAG: hypothetical protein ACFFAK_00300 [Promethearchaeota archaeon]